MLRFGCRSAYTVPRQLSQTLKCLLLPWSPFSESGGRSSWHLAIFVRHYSPMTFTITRLSRCPSNSA